MPPVHRPHQAQMLRHLPQGQRLPLGPGRLVDLGERRQRLLDHRQPPGEPHEAAHVPGVAQPAAHGHRIMLPAHGAP